MKQSTLSLGFALIFALASAWGVAAGKNSASVVFGLLAAWLLVRSEVFHRSGL